MSVEGEVIEMYAVRKVRSGKDFVPMRRLTLEQDSQRISVTLCREAAIAALNIGERVNITHTKANKTEYGVQLQTSTFTKIEKPKEQKIFGEIIGVMDSESSGGDISGSSSSGKFCCRVVTFISLIKPHGSLSKSFLVWKQ
ncbi:hypothetical protein OYC64_005508 [Pagothenia borchgrevinki]|uniref:Uncharacterized protein n=1 Tax=Pagothenia borchgrevinki TaxID=8213 RepID=A0ABD2GG36_PAGBO